MLGAIALLGLAALAGSGRRSRGLGDAPALPADVDAVRNEGQTVWLLRPKDFAHPAIAQKVEERAETEGGQWAVVSSEGWSNAKHFKTAKSARTALTAAGFKGPYGKGTSSRWTR
jgi:hypothetical protein